jgi:hypothetical protein
MDVLAVTHTQEPSAAWVAEAVAKRGHRLIPLHTDLFPNAPMVRRTQRGAELAAAIQVDGLWVPLDASTSIWWRRVNLSSKVDPAMGAEAQAAAVEESRITLRGLASAHAGLVVDRPHHIRLVGDKALQLGIAAQVGLDVLPTLVTNDPESARAFFHEHHGEVITKMEHAFALNTAEGTGAVHTSVVTEDDLDGLDGLTACPMIFQPRVRTRREYRITIVGERLMIGALDYTSGAFGTDWRLASLRDKDVVYAWKPASLPDSVCQAMLRLMDRLGLNYGAADILEDEAGRLWFLEVNPAGEWAWMNHAGLPIVDALADLLTGQVPARDCVVPRV